MGYALEWAMHCMGQATNGGGGAVLHGRRLFPLTAFPLIAGAGCPSLPAWQRFAQQGGLLPF